VLTLTTGTFWPKASLAWIVLSFVLIALSARLVTPASGRRSQRRRAAAGGAAT
jgi:hypothetical protein